MKSDSEKMRGDCLLNGGTFVNLFLGGGRRWNCFLKDEVARKS